MEENGSPENLRRDLWSLPGVGRSGTEPNERLHKDLKAPRAPGEAQVLLASWERQ